MLTRTKVLTVMYSQESAWHASRIVVGCMLASAAHSMGKYKFAHDCEVDESSLLDKTGKLEGKRKVRKLNHTG